jgi:hypothetical protein
LSALKVVPAKNRILTAQTALVSANICCTLKAHIWQNNFLSAGFKFSGYKLIGRN